MIQKIARIFLIKRVHIQIIFDDSFFKEFKNGLFPLNCGEETLIKTNQFTLAQSYYVIDHTWIILIPINILDDLAEHLLVVGTKSRAPDA